MEPLGARELDRRPRDRRRRQRHLSCGTGLLEDGPQGPDRRNRAVHLRLRPRAGALDSGAPHRSWSQVVLSYLLSLLIFVPLGGTPFVYLLTKMSRRAGIYLVAGVTSVTFLLAL